MEKQSNTLAVVALVLGIIACLFDFIHIIPVIGSLCAIGGIVTGALGIEKKQGAMALIGLCLSVASF